jgi:serine-type D-Ala-D-Ala carboxypeptidase (penicillin-binding protein 5/6)
MNQDFDTTDAEFILDTPAEGLSPDETVPSATRFSVLPHLLLLGVILVGLFSTIIIPKTLSYLHRGDIPPVSEIYPLPEVAAVTASVDPFTENTYTAEAIHVWDIAEQKTLFSQNGEEVLPLASITKLMSSLLSYELLPDDTPVTISAAAAAEQSGGTLTAGEVFPVKKLADFALVTSYNSAAHTLADSVGALLGDNDPVDQFVAAMNLQADELGFDSFEFYNPTGLDVSTTQSGGYGSAADVNRLMEHLLIHYPEILLPTITPRTKLYNSIGGHHEADNTNDIVRNIPNLLGSKTGYTDLAGGNLTIVFDAGFNHYVAITVLGSTRNERFSDMEKLIATVLTTTKKSVQ